MLKTQPTTPNNNNNCLDLRSNGRMNTKKQSEAEKEGKRRRSWLFCAVLSWPLCHILPEDTTAALKRKESSEIRRRRKKNKESAILRFNCELCLLSHPSLSFSSLSVCHNYTVWKHPPPLSNTARASKNLRSNSSSEILPGERNWRTKGKKKKIFVC